MQQHRDCKQLDEQCVERNDLDNDDIDSFIDDGGGAGDGDTDGGDGDCDVLRRDDEFGNRYAELGNSDARDDVQHGGDAVADGGVWGSSKYASSTSSAVSVTVTSSTAACTETLEGEEGPYFVDDSDTGYDRSNILSNLDGTETQTGVALALTLYVFDSEKECAAMEGVQVDVWHCNASGIYSAESSESTTAESWLRGYQITDANGMVEFKTIIPGWYSGRTTHIHLRLRSTYDDTDTSGSNTMQLCFDQTLVDTLATSVSPYASEGTNPTTNASDRVYSEEEDGTTLMTLSGSTSAGYTASFNVYLPIDVSSDSFSLRLRTQEGESTAGSRMESRMWPIFSCLVRR